MIWDMHRASNEAATLIEMLPEANAYICWRVALTQSRSSRRSNHGIWVIQPRDIAKDLTNSIIHPNELREWLYWTALFSQIVFTHHAGWYSDESIAKRIMFPEILGDCPGACMAHLPPEAIANLISRQTPTSEEYSEPQANVLTDVGLERNGMRFLSIISDRPIEQVERTVVNDVVSRCRPRSTRQADL